MSKYSPEFKMEAVKRVETSNLPIARVAVELGVNENTLHGWLKRYKIKEDNPPFPGSGKLSTEDAQLKKLEKENRELREELEILKKAAVYFAKNLK